MTEKAAPRREPKQSRSRDTVEVLLDAAERILRTEGAQALTTKHVAAVAGVGVGTLYQYFPSKDAIVAALERRMWSRSLVVMQEAIARTMGRPAEEVISAVVAAAIDQLWPSTALHGWTVPDQLAAPLREEVGDMTKTAVEAIAAALQGLGDQVYPKNARLAAYLVIHMVTNLTRVAVRDHPEAVRSGEVTAEITRMVTRYLLVK